MLPTIKDVVMQEAWMVEELEIGGDLLDIDAYLSIWSSHNKSRSVAEWQRMLRNRRVYQDAYKFRLAR